MIDMTKDTAQTRNCAKNENANIQTRKVFLIKSGRYTSGDMPNNIDRQSIGHPSGGSGWEQSHLTIYHHNME
jgi:hypothetical protein